MKIKRIFCEETGLSQRTEIIFSLTFSNKSSLIAHFILSKIFTAVKTGKRFDNAASLF